jgi:hypothetical protein
MLTQKELTLTKGFTMLKPKGMPLTRKGMKLPE